MAPKVSEVHATQVNTSELVTTMIDTTATRVSGCKIHKNCMGHLQTSAKGGVLVPKWLVSDDPEMMDARATAAMSFVNGSLEERGYGRAIRQTLMGKRGLARYRLLGSKPITSSRGVASCVWGDDPHVVYMPSRWMKSIKVPFCKSDQGYKSPYFSFREVRDGDRAVLIRCPIVTDSSVQPITVRPWDNLSIGVHPEMCTPLNLDFDGDEVHVTAVSDEESVAEIDYLIATSGLSKFSAYQGLPANDGDFMVGSTVSMRELAHTGQSSKYHRICRCKEESRMPMVDIDTTPLSRRSHGLLGQWSDAMLSLVVSHLSVSKGYTFSRQLKAAASTVMYDNGTYRVNWSSPRSSNPTVPMYMHPVDEPYYGLPAVRSAGKLAGVLMQSYLDMAKKNVASTHQAMFASLVSRSDVHSYVIRTGDRMVVLSSGSRPAIAPGSSLVATTDPSVIKSTGSRYESMAMCSMAVDLACRKSGIQVSRSEVVALSCLVYSAIEVTGCAHITDSSPRQFLSHTPYSRVVGSLIENLGVIDRADLEADHPTPPSPSLTSSLSSSQSSVAGLGRRLQGCSMQIDDVYSALVLGNMSAAMRLSTVRLTR